MTDPLLTFALGQPEIWPFGAIKIELPGKTLRMIGGSGVLTIGGETYAGSDEDFGTLAAIDVISEGMDDEAPEIQIGMYPADGVALATLCNPAMQGARVTAIFGAVDPATMTPIGEPDLLFYGEVDVPTMRTAQRLVELTAVGAFEPFFEVDEGQRASDAFHESIWPGETGLNQMTGTTEKLYWGALPPSGATSGYPTVYTPYAAFGGPVAF